ncbi:protein-L-isoaspartate(D-aspartate) O-methyltransferase, partial [Metarhizium majus ARSEF 297]
MTPKQFSQVEQAQKSYQTRAKDYDSSWHPQYTARFMELIGIRPGDRVLVLACGTGLEAVHCMPASRRQWPGDSLGRIHSNDGRVSQKAGDR